MSAARCRSRTMQGRAHSVSCPAGGGRRRTVSRVLFRPRVPPWPARIIHLGAALLRRSSALTQVPPPPRERGRIERAALHGTSIRACSGRGLPRRRSPGRRAWALTPRFHPCLCLRGSSRRPGKPSAVCFLLRFPSGRPGSPLATSLPCGARTFLPRTVYVRRRSSVHLRPRQPTQLEEAGQAGRG